MQCQSQLKTLYAEGIEGSDMEFAAYNLLCVIMHSNNNRDLVSSMARFALLIIILCVSPIRILFYYYYYYYYNLHLKFTSLGPLGVLFP